MRTCDHIAEYLKRRNICDFFGFQGGAVTPLIDALVSRGLRYHQCLHEQASGFAAEAWARITGKTGVVVVTNGPGVTNAVTAVANANLDSTPCVFLFGQVNRADGKRGSARQNGFQEINAVDMVRPICKFAESMSNANGVYSVLNQAFFAAESGRKGVACIDIPMDVLLSESPATCEGIVAQRVVGADNISDIGRAAEMLSSAKRPVILAGAGVRSAGAVEALRKFVDDCGIPVAKTLMGLDTYCGDCIGFSGVYGHVAANKAIFESDVLLVLGARLAKRQVGKSIAAYAPHAKIIHVDIAPEELGDLPAPELAINIGVGDFLSLLSGMFNPGDYSKWRETVTMWKVRYADAICRNSGIDPIVVLRALSSLAPNDIVVTLDVGQNEMWCAQGLSVKEGQRVLPSGGLGCMGFSLPAAIGAAIAGRHVWAFTGDGGLQMNIQELQTVANGRLPIQTFVFNNKSLGMIQEGQAKYHEGRFYGTKSDYSVPDLRRLSDAYGLRYAKLSYENIDEIAAIDESALVEIEISESPSHVLTRYDNPGDYA